MPETGPAPTEAHPPLRVRLRDWLRQHPWRSAVIAASVVLLIDIVTLPWFSLYGLRIRNPETTAFQQAYIRDQESKGKKGTIRKNWVPLSGISENVILAVVVAEDGMFWSHGGFDWFEFRESVLRNLREGRAARGASTITQQLIKNLYLSASKNPVRKLNEWILTWFAEQVLPKRRILELYLNVIEWGPGIYGIDAAARSTYGTSASTLTREQAARLAAVIPNPKRFRPLSGSNVVRRRTEIILTRMSARDRARGRVEVPDVPDDEGSAPGDTLVEPSGNSQ